MSVLNPCSVCRSMAIARCRSCGGYICDSECESVHSLSCSMRRIDREKAREVERSKRRLAEIMERMVA